MSKIYVIGIGYKPFDKKAKEIILSSEVILTSKRLFEVFQGYEEFETVKGKVSLLNNINDTIEFIHNNHKTQKIVLLASGDPLFSGIGRRAVNEFGKDMVEIVPDLSSIQMAFSKIREPWDDAFLMSLHGGPDPAKRRRLPYEIHDIPFLLEKHGKIAILTDRENNPSEIAKEILNYISASPTVIARSEATKQSQASEIASPAARNDNITMYICERLGYPDEKITEGTPEEIAGMSFSEPNVVIIQTIDHRPQTTENPPSPPFSKGGMGGFLSNDKIRFGLKEDEIAHSKSLITKDEVRAVTIHKLRLPQSGVLWDIGAGSGSVSIEAARLCPQLKIFAVEKDKEQIDNIRKNKIRFEVLNLEIIEGSAPDALKDLPAPDRVFIGGSGGSLREIIGFIDEMPVKIVVINAATIETLNEAIRCLENSGFEVEVSEISVSRSKTIANKRHMSALNPVFVIVGEK